MRFVKINTQDIANGTGFRVSLFVSGCRNKCKGCFNKDAWNFDSGTEFDEKAKSIIMNELDKPETEGITILGGEPLEPENQPAILELLKLIKKRYPEKTVWLYTGRKIHFVTGNIVLSSNFMNNDIANTPLLGQIMSLCDVVVDGPFIKELKSTEMFRGSSNQRLIDIQKSLKEKSIVLWHPIEPEVTIVGEVN